MTDIYQKDKNISHQLNYDKNSDNNNRKLKENKQSFGTFENLNQQTGYKPLFQHGNNQEQNHEKQIQQTPQIPQFRQQSSNNNSNSQQQQNQYQENISRQQMTSQEQNLQSIPRQIYSNSKFQQESTIPMQTYNQSNFFNMRSIEQLQGQQNMSVNHIRSFDPIYEQNQNQNQSIQESSQTINHNQSQNYQNQNMRQNNFQKQQIVGGESNRYTPRISPDIPEGQMDYEKKLPKYLDSPKQGEHINIISNQYPQNQQNNNNNNNIRNNQDHQNQMPYPPPPPGLVQMPVSQQQYPNNLQNLNLPPQINQQNYQEQHPLPQQPNNYRKTYTSLPPGARIIPSSELPRYFQQQQKEQQQFVQQQIWQQPQRIRSATVLPQNYVHRDINNQQYQQRQRSISPQQQQFSNRPYQNPNIYHQQQYQQQQSRIYSPQNNQYIQHPVQPNQQNLQYLNQQQMGQKQYDQNIKQNQIQQEDQQYNQDNFQGYQHQMYPPHSDLQQNVNTDTYEQMRQKQYLDHQQQQKDIDTELATRNNMQRRFQYKEVIPKLVKEEDDPLLEIKKNYLYKKDRLYKNEYEEQIQRDKAILQSEVEAERKFILDQQLRQVRQRELDYPSEQQILKNRLLNKEQQYPDFPYNRQTFDSYINLMKRKYEVGNPQYEEQAHQNVRFNDQIQRTRLDYNNSISDQNYLSDRPIMSPKDVNINPDYLLNDVNTYRLPNNDVDQKLQRKFNHPDYNSAETYLNQIKFQQEQKENAKQYLMQNNQIINNNNSHNNSKYNVEDNIELRPLKRESYYGSSKLPRVQYEQKPYNNFKDDNTLNNTQLQSNRFNNLKEGQYNKDDLIDQTLFRDSVYDKYCKK